MHLIGGSRLSPCVYPFVANRTVAKFIKPSKAAQLVLYFTHICRPTAVCKHKGGSKCHEQRRGYAREPTQRQQGSTAIAESTVASHWRRRWTACFPLGLVNEFKSLIRLAVPIVSEKFSGLNLQEDDFLADINSYLYLRTADNSKQALQNGSVIYESTSHSVQERCFRLPERIFLTGFSSRMRRYTGSLVIEPVGGCETLNYISCASMNTSDSENYFCNIEKFLLSHIADNRHKCFVILNFRSTFGPVSIAFCGHLGKTELAVIGLAMSVFNVAGVFVIAGLLTACDTIFAQTYGSKLRSKLSLQLQKAFTLVTLCCIPCAALYISTEPVLLLLGQNPVIATMTADLLVRLIPALVFCAWAQLLTKYVQSQNRVYISLFIIVITNGVNALLHYILLYHLQLGINGAAIAQTLAYFFQDVCFLCYIAFSKKIIKPFSDWSMEFIQNWGGWFRLAIPGLIMVSLEWTLFEIGGIVAGTLGERELAVQTVLISLDSISYSLLPYGFGTATGIRVGQYLGGQEPRGPRSCLSVALLVLWVISPFYYGISIALRWYIPLIFSRNPDVIAMVAELLPVAAIFQILDAANGVCGGVLRGAGLQHIGALINFFSLYLIGGPLGMCLVYLAKYNIEGIWFGLIAGTSLQVTILLIVCFRMNWHKQVELAMKRLRYKEVQVIDVTESSAKLGQFESVGVIAITILCLEASSAESGCNLMLTDEPSEVTDKLVYLGSCESRWSRERWIRIRIGEARPAFVNLLTCGLGATSAYPSQISYKTYDLQCAAIYPTPHLLKSSANGTVAPITTVRKVRETYSSIAAPDGVCTEDESSDSKPKNRITRIVIVKRLVLIGSLLIVLTRFCFGWRPSGRITLSTRRAVTSLLVKQHQLFYNLVPVWWIPRNIACRVPCRVNGLFTVWIQLAETEVTTHHKAHAALEMAWRLVTAVSYEHKVIPNVSVGQINNRDAAKNGPLTPATVKPISSGKFKIRPVRTSLAQDLERHLNRLKRSSTAVEFTYFFVIRCVSHKSWYKLIPCKLQLSSPLNFVRNSQKGYLVDLGLVLSSSWAIMSEIGIVKPTRYPEFGIGNSTSISEIQLMACSEKFYYWTVPDVSADVFPGGHITVKTRFIDSLNVTVNRYRRRGMSFLSLTVSAFAETNRISLT
ncbi:multidrug and toxin extrusion protein 2 [Clonorchis sinensis]|uniref:Multidrug and toxin extrusion protein n=1 Tax=Clonorchis sinensis TaxID=79923 RepID=G7YQZ2_CLOSI|nr:multidrug and toxin extrusion protein 2 [Clonorchis sinensis]